MILRFEEWLTNQQSREDLVGSLAREPDMQHIEHKPSRRKPDEHKNWADIVTRLDEPGRIVVFNEAWQEFLLAKLAAKELLD
jgi:predicted metal-dependent TIM-barrel fold hydrolase